MSDNKFIERLKGTATAKSKLQIDNDVLVQPYDNHGIIDQRDSSIIVAKTAENFSLSGSSLLKTDDDAFTSAFDVSGQGLWINASYVYTASTDPNNPVKAVITPSAKFVLRLVGNNLLNTAGNTLSLTVLVKSTTTVIATKSFNVAVHGSAFCEVLEFESTLTEAVKIQGTKDLTVQVLCGDAGASATLYNGKTVLSVLQRRIDADAIASDNVALADVLNGQTIAKDMFSNPEYIEQVTDGDNAVPQFTRDDDVMNFSGWYNYEDDIASKQDKLIAGANITIAADGKTISATDTIYTAGTNIDITGGVISCTYSLPSNVLTNQSSASNALAAGSGSQASASSTAYGVNAKATSNVTSAFGWASEASGQYSAAFAGKAQGLRSNAFGQGANAKQSYSIQLGEGTNNTANSLQVYSWTLLDNTSGKIPDARLNVIDNTSSTSTTSPLSANMGREMQLEISHLQSIGRFLSFWNCATGLPTTSPQTSPYTYQTGDYFRVGTVATGGASNYKPNGSTYTTGVASTTVETGTVVVGQVYYYDGTNWSLSAGGGSVEVDNQTITFNTDNQIQASGVIETNDNAVTKIWTGESADLPATRDSNTLYNVTDDIGGSAVNYRREVSERNIGEIVYSLIPVTDSGLHLLDGDILDGTGVYSQFYGYMAGLYASGSYSSIFISEASWQASVTAHGVCGKFVIDTANQTIRLPKVTGIIEGTIDRGVIGDLVEAGLPNIKANGYLTAIEDKSGAANNMTSIAVNSMSVGGGAWYRGVGTVNAFDASFSNPIYGNSTTVQPQTIKGYVYMVIANSIKTPIQVDVDNIVNDLNNKANKNLDNVDCNDADFVIAFQRPTADNNYTWYRKYKSGWVEQGGITTTDGDVTITFLKQMADTNYFVTKTNVVWNTNSMWNKGNSYTNKTTSSVTLCMLSGGCWEVKGMAA